MCRKLSPLPSLRGSLPPYRENEALCFAQLELLAGLLLCLGFVVTERASLHCISHLLSQKHFRFSLIESGVHKKCTVCVKYASAEGGGGSSGIVVLNRPRTN